MRGLLLHQVTRILIPLALLYGLALLVKGHDHPGGGFVAGLSWALAAVLWLAAHGSHALRARLEPGTESCLLLGALIVSLSVVGPAFWGEALLKHGSVQFELPLLGEIKLHSSLLFDTGVLLLVAGGLTSVASLLEVQAEEPDPKASDHARKEDLS